MVGTTQYLRQHLFITRSFQLEVCFMSGRGCRGCRSCRSGRCSATEPRERSRKARKSEYEAGRVSCLKPVWLMRLRQGTW